MDRPPRAISGPLEDRTQTLKSPLVTYATVACILSIKTKNGEEEAEPLCCRPFRAMQRRERARVGAGSESDENVGLYPVEGLSDKEGRQLDLF